MQIEKGRHESWLGRGKGKRKWERKKEKGKWKRKKGAYQTPSCLHPLLLNAFPVPEAPLTSPGGSVGPAPAPPIGSIYTLAVQQPPNCRRKARIGTKPPDRRPRAHWGVRRCGGRKLPQVGPGRGPHFQGPSATQRSRRAEARGGLGGGEGDRPALGHCD